MPTQLDLVNLKVMRVTMMKMAMLEMAPQTKNDADDLFATKNDRFIIEDQEKEGLR